MDYSHRFFAASLSILCIYCFCFAESCTKSAQSGGKCYECTTYYRVPVNVAYLKNSTSDTKMECELTSSDVAKMNGDTTFEYEYSALYAPLLIDTIFVNCK